MMSAVLLAISVLITMWVAFPVKTLLEVFAEIPISIWDLVSMQDL
jgi:hypothetical protein